MDKDTIQILNRILPDLPVVDILNPVGSFRVSTEVEEKGLSHEYDYIIAEFLIQAGFATVIQGHSFLSMYRESRVLELTEKGAKFHKSGSYQEYIGLFFLLVLKLFNLDLYHWWFTLPHKTKKVITDAGWGLLFAIVFGLGYEIVKHYFFSH